LPSKNYQNTIDNSEILGLGSRKFLRKQITLRRSSSRSLVRPEARYSKVGIIEAMCINCNKRFESRNFADNYGLVVGLNGETKASV
jgi:hypothetical protein